MNILIVEDEAIIAESIYQLLLLLSYHPYEPVGTPDQAIKIINTNPPDMVILDLSLSDNQSGLEVAAYIRARQLPIPFIMLTAHSDIESISNAKQHRPAAYLVKPFVRASLFAAIEMASIAVGEAEIAEEPLTYKRFVKLGTTHEQLDLGELKYVKAQGKYTELHFSFGRRLIRSSLSTFIEEHKNIKWLRTHKSYAINTDYISKITSNEIIIDKEHIPIGRFFQPRVQQFLAI